MRTSPALVSLLPAMVVLGCGTAPSNEELGDGASELYATSAWNRKNISVCWENPTAQNAQGREWVRKRMEGSWDYVADINFFWGACKEGSKGIRIRIADEQPRVKTFGRGLDGKKGGMTLNFTFKKWSPVCQHNPKHCIQAVALHEFGHALGFMHEQNRPDNPDWCKKGVIAQKGIMIGPYDIHSVMNYCNPKWNNNNRLSAFDIAGVRKVYGPNGGTSEMGGEAEEVGSSGLDTSQLEPLSNDVEESAIPDDAPEGCVDECALGDKACLDDDRFAECADLNGDGCMEWSEPLSCGQSYPGTACVDGYCETSPAPSGCADGEKQCLDGDGWIECQGGSWSAPMSCAQSYPGTVCNAGYCVGCSADGQKQCMDGDSYVECAGGSWSAPLSCAASWPGTVCSQGYCVYP